MYSKLNPYVRIACEVSSYNIGNERKVGFDHRMFYVNRGEATLDIGGREHYMKEGTLVYIPAYTDYAFKFIDPACEMSITVINFDFDSERSDIEASIHPVPYDEFSSEDLYEGYVPEGFADHLLIGEAQNFAVDMQKLRILFFNKDLYFRELSSAILKTLLLGILTRTNDDTAADPALDILDYIKEHYGEKLLARDLGIKFNYHPNHVNRLVKLATGKCFKEYVIFYRVKVACDMLVSTSEPVTVISEACGFTTASYFAELFTREEGVTPREYRKRARESIV